MNTTNAKKNFIIFLACYLAYTGIYVARLNLSMASPEFLAGNFLTNEQVGMMGSAFFVVYAAGRIINGYIGDRTSPWIMISSGLLLAGLSNLLIGFLPPFIGMVVLWGCNAYAQSMLWSSLIKIISEIYPYEQAKKMMSYMVTSVATGNILGILLNTAFINNFGLRFAFVIPGAILLVLCLVIILTTRQVTCMEAAKKHIPMMKLIQDKDLKTMLLPALFHGMIKDNISLWMTVFFVDQYAIDLNASAAFVLFIPIVGFLGRIAYPALNKLYKEQEYKLASHAFVVCIAASVILLSKAIPPVAALLCLSLIYAAISVINTVFLSVFPLQYAANGNQSSVSGIMDFFTYLGAGIGSLCYGYMVSWFGYFAMFLSYAVVAIISVIILETKVIRKKA